VGRTGWREEAKTVAGERLDLSEPPPRTKKRRDERRGGWR
jgi:hypothetical protein